MVRTKETTAKQGHHFREAMTKRLSVFQEKNLFGHIIEQFKCNNTKLCETGNRATKLIINMREETENDSIKNHLPYGILVGLHAVRGDRLYIHCSTLFTFSYSMDKFVYMFSVYYHFMVTLSQCFLCAVDIEHNSSQSIN